MQDSKPKSLKENSSKPIPSKKADTKKSFSINEAIKFGFNFFKENIVTFIKLGVVVILINIFSNAISGGLKGSSLSLIWAILSIGVSIAVQIGVTKIIIDLHDGKPMNFTHFYSLSHLIIRFFAASIVYGLIVMVGIILLIVPGIIWAIKFQFYSFLIVDKEFGIMDSLKKSSAITEGVKIDLALFGLLIIAINILGALALGVGLLVSIPTTLMASVFVYRKLLSQTP